MFRADLEAAGFTTELAFLLDEDSDQLLYQPGKLFAKARLGVQHIRQRRKDLARLDGADLVVVFREALMTKHIFFEREVHARGIPMVLDFDDAIWIRDVSQANRILSAFKDPGKIERILPLCTAVTAGNAYLADFARNFMDSVHIVPSTVDTEVIQPRPRPDRPVTVGWSGSLTTLPHFDGLIPVFESLRERYGDQIRLLTIGAPSSAGNRLGIDYEPWSSALENDLLNQIDIGLMPLPDSPWTRGKCGMKLLLYMAAGKASVASPVGVNAELVSQGRGFTATDKENWIHRVSTLIDDVSVREAMGAKAREYIETHFSRKRWAPDYVRIYSECIAQKPATQGEGMKRKGISLHDQE